MNKRKLTVPVEKKKSEESADELRPEYDFSEMQIVRRGNGRKNPEEITTTLTSDEADKLQTTR